MTDEKSRLAHLSQQPHPAIHAGLCAVFDAWAASAQCPQIALSKEEAFDLALPWTQTLEYCGIAQRIPPWLALGCMTLWSTWNVFKCKARLARDAAAARREVQAAQEVCQN
jgi:hypothetical protein